MFTIHRGVATRLLAIALSLGPVGCGGMGAVLKDPRPATPSLTAAQQADRRAMEADIGKRIAEVQGWKAGLPAAAAGGAVSHAHQIVEAARYGLSRAEIAHAGARRIGPDLLWDLDNAIGAAVRDLPAHAERLASSGRLAPAIEVLDAARGIRRYWSPSQETAMTRQLHSWRDAARAEGAGNRSKMALRACEQGAPSAAQFIRDGAIGSGGVKLELKLPDRCEGEAGSVSVRVKPEGVDPKLVRALQPSAEAANLRFDAGGPWRLEVDLEWGPITRRVEQGSGTAEVQVGTKVVRNPALISCQGSLADAKRKVEREMSALRAARNASSQARAARGQALRSAQQDVDRTAKRCASLPPTSKEAVMEKRSYPTQTQIAERTLQGAIQLVAAEGKPIRVKGKITARALSVRHDAHPSLGVRAARPAPPSDGEVDGDAWEQIAFNTLKLVRRAARREVKDLRAKVIAARSGPCMAHAEATARLLRIDPATLSDMRKNSKGLIMSEAFDDIAAARECLGLSLKR